MNDAVRKMALAGLGLIRLSGKESSGIVDKLAVVGSSLLNTEVVPNEPLHYDASRYQAVEQSDPDPTEYASRSVQEAVSDCDSESAPTDPENESIPENE